MTSFTIYDGSGGPAWAADTLERRGDLIVQTGPLGRIEYTLTEAQQMIDAFTALINETQENK